MRLIDAEALKTKIQKIKAEALEHGFAPESVCGDILLNFLDNAPTSEAKPVVRASWTEVSGGRIICDHCGEYPLYDYFGRIKLSRCCPTCGALMGNGGHWLFRKAEEYLKENSCDHIAEAGKKEPISQTHENGVKIPVISMEDVPKLMREGD